MAEGHQQVQPGLAQPILGQGGEGLGVAGGLLGLDHLDVARGPRPVGDLADLQGLRASSAARRLESTICSLRTTESWASRNSARACDRDGVEAQPGGLAVGHA